MSRVKTRFQNLFFQNQSINFDIQLRENNEVLPEYDSIHEFEFQI